MNTMNTTTETLSKQHMLWGRTSSLYLAAVDQPSVIRGTFNIIGGAGG